MALFWHNHFATAYTKIAGGVGGVQATKTMALKAGELPGPQGQIELFRQYALGNFRNLLIEVARDPRWSCGSRPDELSREAAGEFRPRDHGIVHVRRGQLHRGGCVRGGSCVHRVEPAQGRRRSQHRSRDLLRVPLHPRQHDTTAKTFTFPIYSNGEVTIPARAAADGMQDGVDFMSALASHPETARRLARKLWNFFVSELEAPDPAFVEAVAAEYLRNNTEMKPVVRYILGSSWFLDPNRTYARYSWPVEFVVRAIREVGWQGFSVNTVRTPLSNMGKPCSSRRMWPAGIWDKDGFRRAPCSRA